MVNRLVTLYSLQIIDDELDVLEELRGDLPLRVNGLNEKIDVIQEQIDEKESIKSESLEKRIANDEEVERLTSSLKKFKAQLYKVRNNKEYDALTKEIDHSETEIERFETENTEMELNNEKLKSEIEELNPGVEELNIVLKENEVELKKIIKENEIEEARLRAKREKIAVEVKKSDYKVYMRIRKALKGKAIVTINRSACSGCHNIVPSQRQIELRQNRRLFTCESCGRILVSAEVSDEAEKRLS
ncbi:MAG: C4-type zinc ribbon domain-containing protein [Melioribacteraceae bacterium]|jgi:predicted  nucleic acid-binding Zn-ribbon protein|nr:C4-type zinc ribbon domain-containing protein [Melioribacteraceae bacterium]